MAVLAMLPVLPAANHQAVAQERRLRVDPVERRAYVTEIQRQLKRLGCYDGAIDGRLDRTTLAAVERLRGAIGRRQFARYRLASLNRRASAITASQFDAWVDRLRAVDVRCANQSARRDVEQRSAERRSREQAATPAPFRQFQPQGSLTQGANRPAAEARRPATATEAAPQFEVRPAPRPAPPSDPVGGSGPPSGSSDGRAERSVSGAAPRPAATPSDDTRPATIPSEGPRPAAEPTQPAITRSARSRAAPSSVAPAPSAEPFDVVPVFYGTDRLREDDAKRARYGSVRAKRLELGQALVSIPKIHVKPQVERPWVYHLPFTGIVMWSEKEDPAKHFTIRNARHLTRDAFVDLIKQRLGNSSSYKDHALVFIHGFNTTFDWALYRAAQIAYDLKFDGAMFTYSFPSRGDVNPTAYAYDRESAGQAQSFFEDFLKLVTRETGAKTISIIAHSMGNQLLLPVLKDLQRSSPPDLKISQVILAAPDVDRDNFELLARQITGISKGFTLYAAANDWALKVSQKFWGDVPRAGEVPAGGPIVVAGIDTIDVTKTSTEFLSLGHNGYAEKSALLNDIELLIRTGERPPEARFPILKRVKTDAGAEYWLYP